jgi:uncharacterized repeat protein (TIGR04002 family)
MKNKRRITYMVLASLFAAIIAVFVAWFFHIPVKIGANSAYLHFGDVFIFLAASLLPAPYAAAAAGIGGGFGDLFCGAAEWIPFTVIIKILVALCFSAKSEKLLSKRNLCAPIFALLITVGGYYVAEALIFGNWISPVLSIFGNVVQIVGSAILYYIMSGVLQKFNIKNTLLNK